MFPARPPGHILAQEHEIRFADCERCRMGLSRLQLQPLEPIEFELGSRDAADEVSEVKLDHGRTLPHAGVVLKEQH